MPSAAPTPRAGARRNLQYDAFVSYAHTADAMVAPRLQRSLERFGAPWYRPRALRLFRDASDLAASPALWTGIEQGLAGSRWLLLLASPQAAASPWCERECRWWLAHASIERLLIVLTDGEIAWDAAGGRCDAARTTALPPSLVAALRDEPLYVDLRWARQSDALADDNPRWQAATLDLAAPLHGKPKAEMDGDAVRARRRNRRWIAGTVSLLTVLTVAAGSAAWVARWQAEQAAERGRAAKRAALVAAARSFPDDATRAGALIRETTEALPTFRRSARLLDGLDQPVRTLAFSPDGRQLAGATDAGPLMLWTTDETPNATRLAGATGGVRMVAFDARGARLLAASLDGTLRLWTPSSGAEPEALGAPGDPLYAAHWSADGGTVLSFAHAETELRIFGSQPSTRPSLQRWNLAAPSAPVAFGPAAGEAVRAAFSAGGGQAAVATRDGRVSVWWTADARGATLPGRVSAHVTALAIERAGRRVAAGGADGRIHVWSVGTAAPARMLDAHTLAVTALAFVGDGAQLLSTSEDGTLRMWDLQGDVAPQLLGSHAQAIGTLAVSSDEARAATGSTDGRVRVWRLGSAAGDGSPAQATDLLRQALRQSERQLGVEFVRDRIVGLSPVDARLMAQLQRQEAEFAGSDGAVSALVFSADGTQLASGDTRGGVRLWQVALPPALQPVRFEVGAAVRGLLLSDDGEWLLQWRDDGVRHGRADGTGPAVPLAGASAPPSAVALRGDARLALVGAADGNVAVWQLDAGRAKRLAELRGLDGEVLQLAFLAPGNQAAVGRGRTAQHLWDLAEPRQPRLRARLPHNAELSPDGRLLAVPGAFEVELRDLQGDGHARRLRWPEPHSGTPSGTLRWSLDGRWLVGCIARAGAGTPARHALWRPDDDADTAQAASLRYEAFDDVLQDDERRIPLFRGATAIGDPCGGADTGLFWATSANGRRAAAAANMVSPSSAAMGVAIVLLRDQRTWLWRTGEHCTHATERMRLLGESPADAERAVACCRSTLQACRRTDFGTCAELVTRRYADLLRPCEGG